MSSIQRIASDLRELRWGHVLVELVMLVLGILIALAAGPAAADKQAAASALSHLMTRRTLRLSRTAYTDLIGTGNIRLIRNAGLRDRIVNLYETNERLVTILDRNNQVYVDQMYVLYLLDTALITIRSSSNLAPLDAAMKDLDVRIAVPVDTSADQLWRLDPAAPEWGVLRGKVRMRGAVSLLAIRQSQGIVEQVTAVRKAVGDEIARRWPGQA